MGTVGDASTTPSPSSFFASLQCELLDRHHWPTRAELARAMFDWIEGFYNPTRRHSTLGYLSPVDYERQTTASRGMITTPNPSVNRGSLQTSHTVHPSTCHGAPDRTVSPPNVSHVAT